MGYIIIICITVILTYLILKSKITQTQQIDELVKKENEELQTLQKELSWQTQELQSHLIELTNKKVNILNDINNLNEEIIDIKSEVNQARDKALEEMSNELSKAAELESQKYQQTKDNYEKDFLDFQKQIADETKKITNALKDLQSKEAAAVEANKRAQEKKDKENFYKIILSDEDKAEIIQLREISAHLKIKEPLNKVIWKFYYEKPFTDLVGRVLGAKTITGIYKLTNLTNNKCYVGQAVDVANRWKTHVKRGMGAEPMNNNKLYPAMIKDGVENFSFELIEECSRDKLNEREQFWQDYFKAKEFGYSIK